MRDRQKSERRSIGIGVNKIVVNDGNVGGGQKCSPRNFFGGCEMAKGEHLSTNASLRRRTSAEKQMKARLDPAVAPRPVQF